MGDISSMKIINYELGDMVASDGVSMGYRWMSVLGEYVQRISKVVVATPAYEKLFINVPSERLLLYFQFYIKEEIAPFIRLACIKQWCIDHGKRPPGRDCVIRVPKTGVFSELINCWNFKDVPIRAVNPIFFAIMDRNILKKHVRAYAKKIIREISKRCVFFKHHNRIIFNPPSEGMVACHFAEGVDVTMRNDLSWYFGSSIKPGNVLIYFDSESDSKYRRMNWDTLEQINGLGFKWVSLRKTTLHGKRVYNYWSCPAAPSNIFIKGECAITSIEKWIISLGNDLLEQVNYWRSFYNEFNVKINYIPNCAYAVNIIQSIAFDIDIKEPGFTVGRQRSEMSMPTKDEIGCDPKHVYCIWSERALPYFCPNYDRIEQFVITGYVYNSFKPHVNWPNTLRSKGAKFVITFYDNTFNTFSYFCRKNLLEYYQVFLEWLIEDKDLGLIIKSKRPEIIKALPTIHRTLARAVETGRCIIIGELGRHPLEASYGSDMSVGFGISTPIVEVTAAGLRGIHCDTTRLKTHEFYEWGYEELIFDNLENLIKVLKSYKEDNTNYPRLGDWSRHIDKLDPFHDGKGGDRMGVYMGWLFDALAGGKDRDEVIRHANSLYKKKWGEDKIVHIDERPV